MDDDCPKSMKGAVLAERHIRGHGHSTPKMFGKIHLCLGENLVDDRLG